MIYDIIKEFIVLVKRKSRKRQDTFGMKKFLRKFFGKC